jgi:hypothetical protein
LKTKATHARAKGFWTHPSVVALQSDDPIHSICAKANTLALLAIQAGWSGPPFDPTKLAEILGIRVVPREEVGDARTVPLPDHRLQIEFNPNKPRARVRYSIAHELAHTLFPDCHKSVRHRASAEQQERDDWQLEMLCNLGAAELLMPIGSFPELRQEDLTIDRVLTLRKQFEVSTEAVLLRSIRLTDSPLAVFTASRREHGPSRDRYCLDYSVGSRRWRLSLASGSVLPKETMLADCTAMGYTAKGNESWGEATENLHVEVVGIAPFPGKRFPRVAGIVRPTSKAGIEDSAITFLVGDALTPRGDGHRIVAHVVNDKTPNWGAGFGMAVRRKWPAVQDAFRRWAENTPRALTLGNVFHTTVDAHTTVFQLICQHGYGPSPTPRLRYAALNTCLEELADFALAKRASIHMPRIGVGEGGGAWGLIEQLIDASLCAQSLRVAVYDLPESATPSLRQRQPGLFA